jgi:hypothetical protein
MRLCHSIWTKPLISLHDNPIQILIYNIWLFSLSVAYIKKLDLPIVLHTDKSGKELLGFLPYDEIFESLNTISTSEYFWAAGKIYAQSYEPLGSIHIDGDVFLKNIELKELFEFQDFDILIQNTEQINEVYTNHILIFNTYFKGNPAVTEKFLSKVPAFNCGVVGFNNQKIKDLYISDYLNAISTCSKNKSFMDYISKNNDTFIPDLILEQWNLSLLAEKNSCKIKQILSNTEDIYSEATRIGFTHLIGKSKYDLIEKVKSRLFEINPTLFRMAENHITNLNISI